MSRVYHILLLSLLLVSQCVVAQTRLSGDRGEAIRCLNSGDVPTAILLFSNAIEQAKDSRNASTGVDGDLLGEYAYALALNHDYEAALINIDRCRTLPGKYQDFYTAQVFYVMGFEEASSVMSRNADIPASLRSSYGPLNGKYASRARISGMAPGETLKRANEIAAKGLVIQAIALLEELRTGFPEEPLVYINESAVWETMGYYKHAENLLRKGIQLMPSNPENKIKIQTYKKHLTSLSGETDRIRTSRSAPGLMIYGGASYTSGLFSVNSRIGLYTSSLLSVSLNAGLSFSEEHVLGNIGISGYKTWKCFVLGAGLTDQIEGKSHQLCFTPAVGLSFLNKNRSSSFDIMLNLMVPFSSNGTLTYSVSIGKTVYLDFNKKKR